MFDFRDLVANYSTPITIIEESEGYYDYENGGKWVPGEPQEIEATAAVVQMSVKELNTMAQYGEGGVYTRDDRKIYIHRKLKIGQKIIHKGLKYKISQEADYSDLTEGGLRVYYARKVGE